MFGSSINPKNAPIGLQPMPQVSRMEIIMQNFVFYNPVQVIFGKNSLNNLSRALDKFPGNILLVTGSGSVRKNGIYDRIIDILHNRYIVHIEGVKSNPELSKVKDGISTVRHNDIKFILAVGGGSVIDTAKAIAVGAQYDGDVWDFYAGKSKPRNAVALGTVLTIAATGSEMNPISVITNSAVHEKVGIGHYLMYPQFSILDPVLTMTVPMKNTVYSAVDIIAHALEGYFTKEDDNTPLQNGMVFSIVRTVIESMNTLIDDSGDYDARSSMMWASTLALNGILTAGIGKYSFENHMLGHTLSAYFDTPHGASLSLILPAWLKENRKKLRNRIITLGREIFNSAEDAPDAVIDEIERYFKKIGAPVRLREAGIGGVSDEMIDNVIDIASRRGIQFERKYIKDIYERAL